MQLLDIGLGGAAASAAAAVARDSPARPRAAGLRSLAHPREKRHVPVGAPEAVAFESPWSSRATSSMWDVLMRFAGSVSLAAFHPSGVALRFTSTHLARLGSFQGCLLAVLPTVNRTLALEHHFDMCTKPHARAAPGREMVQAIHDRFLTDAPTSLVGKLDKLGTRLGREGPRGAGPLISSGGGPGGLGGGEPLFLVAPPARRGGSCSQACAPLTCSPARRASGLGPGSAEHSAAVSRTEVRSGLILGYWYSINI